MRSEDEKRVEALFDQAVELPSDQHTQLLDRECGGHAEIRAKVERLLELDQQGLEAGLSSPAYAPEFSQARDQVESIQRLGQYRIVEKIGEGGMGIVYRAEQAKPKREVALKVLRPGMASRQLLRRFEHEAQVLGQFHHPGIGQIYEAGIEEVPIGEGRTIQQPFFAMELVRGEPLDRYCEHRQLGIRERLELLATICDALHHAHQKGVIHRDLKPGNILVDETGQPKILDFGVARVTDADMQTGTTQTEIGQLLGTLPYMSPEQVTGLSEKLDARSDVYALGVILYELLAGRLPHDLRKCSIPEAIRIIQKEDPSRLGSIGSVFRGDIETLVGKALEKDPERRYQAASSLAADIRRYLHDEPIAARRPSTWYQVRKFTRRNKALVAGLALTFAVLIFGSITTTIFAIRARGNAEEALNHKRAARHETYRVSLAAATSALALGDASSARASLKSAPPEYRGWEWYYLHAQLTPYIAEFTGTAPLTGGKVCFTTDGTRLVTALRDHTVAVWDVATGVQVRSLRAESDLVAIARNLPGNLVAAGAEDGSVYIWNIDTGERLVSEDAHTGFVTSLAWDTTGARLATVDRRTIRIWSNGESSVLTEFEEDEYVEFVRDMSFSPMGDRLAIVVHPLNSEFTGPAHLEILDVTTGEERGHYMSWESAFSCEFTGGGAEIAVGTAERNIHIVDTRTLDRLGILSGHLGMVSSLSLSPDGARLVSCATDGTIRVWDTNRHSQRTLLSDGGSTPGSVAWSPDGHYLATVRADEDTVRLWDRSAGVPTVLDGHKSYVYALCFSPDGTLIASASWDGTVRLWEAATGGDVGSLTAEPPSLPGEIVRMSAVCFTGDGRQVIGSDLWGAYSWSPDTGESLFAIEFVDWMGGRRIAELIGEEISDREHVRFHPGGAFTPDGRLYVSGGIQIASHVQDHSIWITDISDNNVTEIAGHTGGVWGVAISHDGRLIASASDDQTIRIWDAQTHEGLVTLEGHLAPVYCVDFSPDGTRLVSGGNDNSIRVWDTETWKQVLVMRGHDQYVKAVAFSPDGSQVVSGSGDGTVRVWDTVPAAKRHRQAQAARRLRADQRPRVERLLGQHGKPSMVAGQLRSDPSLDENDRRAALRVLLSRTQTRHEN